MHTTNQNTYAVTLQFKKKKKKNAKTCGKVKGKKEKTKQEVLHG